jgi:hypothetical protein
MLVVERGMVAKTDNPAPLLDNPEFINAGLGEET